MNTATGLIAGYNQAKTSAMVADAPRLGKKVVVHARGAEGALDSARAAIDVILHTSWIDNEGLGAVVANDSRLCPTLSLGIDDIEFTQPTDKNFPCFLDARKRKLKSAQVSLTKAREAGVAFVVGSDCGFAITPYGEWSARELEYYVEYLGFPPAQALRCATQTNGHFVRNAAEVGIPEAGRQADILIVDGDPLEDISVLQEKSRIRDVFIAGEPIALEINDTINPVPLETSYRMWNEV